MAVVSRKIGRELLAKVAGGNFEALKYLENLGQDVIDTLPEEIAALQGQAESAQSTADNARSLALLAQALAVEALEMQGELDGVRALLSAQHARISTLAKRLDGIESGYIAL